MAKPKKSVKHQTLKELLYLDEEEYLNTISAEVAKGLMEIEFQKSQFAYGYFAGTVPIDPKVVDLTRKLHHVMFPDSRYKKLTVSKEHKRDLAYITKLTRVLIGNGATKFVSNAYRESLINLQTYCRDEKKDVNLRWSLVFDVDEKFKSEAEKIAAETEAAVAEFNFYKFLHRPSESEFRINKRKKSS